MAYPIPRPGRGAGKKKPAAGSTLASPAARIEHLARRVTNKPAGSIAEGRANKAIADELFVSVKTVEDHSRSLFTKLGVAPAPGYNQRVLAVLEWLRRSG